MAQSPASKLALASDTERAEMLDGLSEEDVAALMTDWAFWARPEQLAPDWTWFIWLLMGGRGSGKSRAGAEWLLQRFTQGYQLDDADDGAHHLHRAALVGRTVADIRLVQVEGESGLIACSEAHGLQMSYQPSNRKLIWPDLNAEAVTYTAEEPEGLRGPQHESGWADEVASWRLIKDSQGNTAWTNLILGLRLGDDPRVVGTTTPKPIPLVKELFENAGPEVGHQIALSTSTLYDNAANLPRTFINQIRADYEGTSLAGQEIYGLLLAEATGASFKLHWVESNRVTEEEQVPVLKEIAVAIDPAFSDSDTADETGIIVGGLERDAERPMQRRAFILEDLSCRATANHWARIAVEAYWRYGAQALVVEANLGGKRHMEEIIHTVDPAVNVKATGARGSKQGRAAAPAGLYEQNRVCHVGYFGELESEMITYVDGDKRSPNRMDALVHLLTHLLPKVSHHGAKTNVSALVGARLPGAIRR